MFGWEGERVLGAVGDAQDLTHEREALGERRLAAVEESHTCYRDEDSGVERSVFPSPVPGYFYIARGKIKALIHRLAPTSINLETEEALDFRSGQWSVHVVSSVVIR